MQTDEQNWKSTRIIFWRANKMLQKIKSKGQFTRRFCFEHSEFASQFCHWFQCLFHIIRSVSELDRGKVEPADFVKRASSPAQLHADPALLLPGESPSRLAPAYRRRLQLGSTPRAKMPQFQPHSETTTRNDPSEASTGLFAGHDGCAESSPPSP